VDINNNKTAMGNMNLCHSQSVSDENGSSFFVFVRDVGLWAVVGDHFPGRGIY